VLPSQIAFDPSGDAAIGFGIRDLDNPAFSNPFLVTRAPAGGVSGMSPIPHAQQLLALAYLGSQLQLLTAGGPATLPCCTTAQVLQFGKGSYSHARTLLPALSGTTIGQLVVLPHSKLLVAVGSEDGIWVIQGRGRGRFGPVHQLTAVGAQPQSLAATALANGKSIVVWTVNTGLAPAVGANVILAADGTPGRAPTGERVLVTVPGGHLVDEIGVVPGVSVPLLAWVESWFDSAGTFHSEVLAKDLNGKGSARPFQISGQVASGLAAAGNGAGEQALAWSSCMRGGTCAVRATLRSPGGRFAQPLRLGSIDASQAPTVAVGPSGEAIVGWVSAGRVFADVREPGSKRFAGVKQISAAVYASDLALAFSPTGGALATWTQGLQTASVYGSVLEH
jgi:hypothetical protein